MGAHDQLAHGALDHAELAALGVSAAGLRDFSSNLNPFGPPAGVRAALAALDPAPYPDRSCRELRLTLAERHGCEPEALLPGNGANELIHLLARALLRPGDSVLVLGPTYGEYAHASRLAGADVCELRSHEAGAFALDWPAISLAVARLRPRLVWLCAPNNPTGIDASDAQIAALAAHCRATGGCLVHDGSYRDLRRAGTPPGDATGGATVAIRSLTKSFALAGLRLGYLLADPTLIAQVAAYQPAWSVSSAAQAAGLAALADRAFLPASVPQLWAASDGLAAGVRGLGLTVWRAALPFLLVRTGVGTATRAALLRRGSVVRDCASFGLAAWVRVAPRRPEENAALLEAWKELR